MERDTKFIKRISLSNNKLDKFLDRDKKGEEKKKMGIRMECYVIEETFIFKSTQYNSPKYINSSFE